MRSIASDSERQTISRANVRAAIHSQLRTSIPLMVIIAVAVSAAAAIGAHIFHKSAISTAHMLAHTSLHACGKC